MNISRRASLEEHIAFIKQENSVPFECQLENEVQRFLHGRSIFTELPSSHVEYGRAHYERGIPFDSMTFSQVLL